MNLNESTQVIIHRAKSTKLNIWDMGNDLLFIQNNEQFKEENFNSMEDYVNHYEEKFGFGYRQAQKYIAIAKELKRDELSSSVPLSKLYLLTQVPQEQRDKIISRVQAKNMSREDVEAVVKSMKAQAGTEPSYPSSPEEHILKLIRQWKEIKAHTEATQEAIKRLQSDLETEIANWIQGAKKYAHLNETIRIYLKEAQELIK